MLQHILVNRNILCNNNNKIMINIMIFLPFPLAGFLWLTAECWFVTQSSQSISTPRWEVPLRSTESSSLTIFHFAEDGISITHPGRQRAQALPMSTAAGAMHKMPTAGVHGLQCFPDSSKCLSECIPGLLCKPAGKQESDENAVVGFSLEILCSWRRATAGLPFLIAQEKQ